MKKPYNFVMDETEIQQLDRLESTHFWYLARKDQLTKWISGLNQDGLIVLDLGSATGGNTLHISSLGHLVTSVEYSQLGAHIQRGKGIPVVQADARNLPFSESTFDVIVCLDVLEHIVEDGTVASEINRVLKPGGKFLISVPEDPKLWSAHDVAVSHVRRYSKSDLVSLIESAGLLVHQVWSSLTLLRPLIVAVRKFTKGSDLKKMNIFVNIALLAICKIELRIPKIEAKGVTLWITGQKRLELK